MPTIEYILKEEHNALSVVEKRGKTTRRVAAGMAIHDGENCKPLIHYHDRENQISEEHPAFPTASAALDYIKETFKRVYHNLRDKTR